MIHALPWRTVLGNINFRLRYSRKWPYIGHAKLTNSGCHCFSSLSVSNIKGPELLVRQSFVSFRECRRASERLTHSEDLSENLGDSKIIPITIVTRFLDHSIDTKSSSPSKEKIVSAVNSSEPKKVLQETISREVAEGNNKGSSPVKTVIPYSKNGSMRNEWSRTKLQRPKTDRENIHFKETYEKLKRLGLLKPRLGNCYVGMTSPSGKYKFETEKTAAQRNGSVALLDTQKKKPRRLPEIKSKFLQNNVVVKVQHFYESQGKEMPEELRTLANGRSLRRRPDASSRSPYKANQRRFQLYPCTSPSQTHFSRNYKNNK